MAEESQSDSKRMANAIHASPHWPVDNLPTSTLEGRDALEQIKGANVDPEYGQVVAWALSTLLGHRADCGFYPRGVTGEALEWMQFAGWFERRNSALGRPPHRFVTRWAREWQ
jgi:hypothetical protein